MALNGPAIGQLQYFNHARLVDVHSTGMLTLLIVGSTATFSGTCTKRVGNGNPGMRSEEHTSELQSQSNLVCRLLLEKKKKKMNRRKWQRASRDESWRGMCGSDLDMRKVGMTFGALCIMETLISLHVTVV